MHVFKSSFWDHHKIWALCLRFEYSQIYLVSAYSTPLVNEVWLIGDLLYN